MLHIYFLKFIIFFYKIAHFKLVYKNARLLDGEHTLPLPSLMQKAIFSNFSAPFLALLLTEINAYAYLGQ